MPDTRTMRAATLASLNQGIAAIVCREGTPDMRPTDAKDLEAFKRQRAEILDHFERTHRCPSCGHELQGPSDG